MATFRVGIGSFNINDGAVGIGTEGTGHGNLKVKGVIKSTDLDVLGVSTFSRYSGFSADEINLNNRDLTLSGEYSTTGDIVVDDNSSLTVGSAGTVCTGSVESVSVKHHFSLPNGGSLARDETSGYPEGTIRFNNDLNSVELFNGNEWLQISYKSDMSYDGEVNSRGSMVVAGGYPCCDVTNTMEIVQISSRGNAQFFGDLQSDSGYSARHNTQGCSNRTRGLIMGGRAAPVYTDQILYYQCASQSSGEDFGNLTTNAAYSAAVASSTRGVCMARNNSPAELNTMDYVEISTRGNAIDFGDAVVTARSNSGASALTRGYQFGGTPVGDTVVQRITIAAKGNSIEFGSLNQGRRNTASFSNTVRAVIAAGSEGYLTSMEYMTASTGGNTTDFGNLQIGRSQPAGGCNSTRGLVSGGTDPNNKLTSIESVEIATTGNAVDFGEMGYGRNASMSASDSHGGLGGY